MNNTIQTNTKVELIDITNLIQRYIDQKNIKEGVIFVHIPHTTAGVTINENADPDVISDLIKGLSIFDREDYLHSEGNSSAHIKSSLVGCNSFIQVKEGSMVLGTWQSIFFCEFDGPRLRKIVINHK